jgi:hypothetical protein
MGKEHIHARVCFRTNSFVHLVIEKVRLFLVATMNTRLKQLDSQLPAIKNLYIFLDARSSPTSLPTLVSPILANGTTYVMHGNDVVTNKSVVV